MPTSKRSYKSNIKQVMIIVNLISQKQVVSGLKKKAAYAHKVLSSEIKQIA